MVTISLNFAPASASVFSILRNVCLNWASKSPASDLPDIVDLSGVSRDVDRATLPSVMTQGENARLTCQVPANERFLHCALRMVGRPPRKRDHRFWNMESPLALDGGPKSILLLRVAIAHCAARVAPGCRHLDVPHAEGGERVDQRIGDRGHGADAARFARAFDPERIGAGGQPDCSSPRLR